MEKSDKCGIVGEGGRRGEREREREKERKREREKTKAEE